MGCEIKVNVIKTKDTVRGFKEILEGKHDSLPENAFMYVGSIEEAVAKAKAKR